MDADRFDSLTRSLSALGTRRRALAALAGSLSWIRLANPGNAAAAESGKCKPKCGECQTCKKGDCKKKNGKKRCKKGKCQATDNGTACSRGTCQNGTCACPPDKPTFCPIQNVCGQCCDNLPCCGKIVCEPREPRCLANRTCGCEDGRPVCFNTGLCCLAGEICDSVIQACTAPSDRNLKTNFGSVDPGDMLGRVRALPITTWNYTSDDASVRHIGPMAQDFAALFGVGADDRHIHPIDGQGVALAAIQGLMAELAQVREDNARLAARITTLEDEQASG